MPSVKSAAQQQLDSLGALLTRLNKRAKEESDPGGYDGDTSHATKDQENGTVDVDEGSHSSELEGDIKHDQPVGIDQEPEGFPGSQDAAQVNIGTQQTGADSTDGNIPSISDNLPDPGGFEGESSHPTADKPNTEKYGTARKLRASLPAVKEAGTDLLAKIVMSQNPTAVKKAGDSVLPPETPGPASGSDDATPDGSVTSGGDSEKKDDSDEKEAAAGAKAAQEAIFVQQQRDAAVIQGLAETIKTAQDNATFTADYLNGFFAQLEKGADEDSSSDDDKKKKDDSDGGDDSSSSDSDSDSSGGPPSNGGSSDDSSGGGGSGDSSIDQLLGGGGGGGGPVSQDIGGQGAVQDMLGGGGGGMGGGAPQMGGAPPMGGAPGGMGGGGQQDQVQMLIEALAQLGITPEQLQAAVGAGGAGGAGGAVVPVAVILQWVVVLLRWAVIHLWAVALLQWKIRWQPRRWLSRS
jgi:hypothetical protein